MPPKSTSSPTKIKSTTKVTRYVTTGGKEKTKVTTTYIKQTSTKK